MSVTRLKYNCTREKCHLYLPRKFWILQIFPENPREPKDRCHLAASASGGSFAMLGTHATSHRHSATRHQAFPGGVCVSHCLGFSRTGTCSPGFRVPSASVVSISHLLTRTENVCIHGNHGRVGARSTSGGASVWGAAFVYRYQTPHFAFQWKTSRTSRPPRVPLRGCHRFRANRNPSSGATVFEKQGQR